MLDVKVVDNQIILGQKVLNEMKKLQEFQITIQEMKNTEEEIKGAILTAMEQNGIKGYENDFIKLTYIAPTTRVSVDTARLKKDGLYDEYTKTSPVKASVRVSYKDD